MCRKTMYSFIYVELCKPLQRPSVGFAYLNETSFPKQISTPTINRILVYWTFFNRSLSLNWPFSFPELNARLVLGMHRLDRQNMAFLPLRKSVVYFTQSLPSLSFYILFKLPESCLALTKFRHSRDHTRQRFQTQRPCIIIVFFCVDSTKFR